MRILDLCPQCIRQRQGARRDCVDCWESDREHTGIVLIARNQRAEQLERQTDLERLIHVLQTAKPFSQRNKRKQRTIKREVLAGLTPVYSVRGRDLFQYVHHYV